MSNPYNPWDRRKSLGVIRDMEANPSYWRRRLFPNIMTSTDEWIEFDKLPRQARKLAPFVMPLSPGQPIYEARQSVTRFKPAYIKLKDVIDALMPLVKHAGVDRPFMSESELTPMQRRDLIRASMALQHVAAIDRRIEWMCAMAILHAKYVVEAEDYPAQLIDFRRDPSHRVIKTSGNFWGDAGVSLFDDVQRYADHMFNAEHGAFPVALTMGSKVWSVVRKDKEMLEHMDTQKRGNAAVVERGLISGEKVVKVGELEVGGSSGARIEMFVYRDTFIDKDGVTQPLMKQTDISLTGSAESVMGVQAYGAIADPNAGYQSLPIFPRNWVDNGDPAAEYMLHQSAPLMVPVNPNATFTATVVDE